MVGSSSSSTSGCCASARTNHLDLGAIDWLEDWLNRFKGAFIVISHDRTFLNRLTKSCLWLDRGSMRRAEIERNISELPCATLRRDGEALKLSRKDRPEDLRRIEAALAGF